MKKSMIALLMTGAAMAGFAGAAMASVAGAAMASCPSTGTCAPKLGAGFAEMLADQGAQFPKAAVTPHPAQAPEYVPAR